MKYRLMAFCIAAGVLSLAYAGMNRAGIDQAPTAQSNKTLPDASQQTWSVWGGEVGVRWNRDFAGDLGISIAPATGAFAERDWRGRQVFAVRHSGSLEFGVVHGHFRGFQAGSLQADGGYRLQLPDGAIDLTNFRLQPDAAHPRRLDLVGADGTTWFYADNLMYELIDSGQRFAVREMDLRINSKLATRLGQPEAANLAIADMELTSDVLRRGVIEVPAGSCNTDNGANCNWTGTAAPNGGTYEADLFMSAFTPQYSRCQGCTGPHGAGEVVFTPSSSLKNNVNAGSIQTTVSGQGDLGRSTALWAADIPWFTKFSGPNHPYNNDQHPFLIWNMYRIDADGSIVQIARSGVKHAFVTINAGAECPYPFSHVLGRGCEDTYATGNNDSNNDLGPRSEIIAATNQWGRCGSIYDPDCDGNQNNSGNGDYDQRLIADESQLSTDDHPGSTWMFESWYLAREDINIYNSMGTVDTTQHWNGSFWGINSSNYKLGSAIDRWVDPDHLAAGKLNRELSTDEGHVKVAVKTTDLGGGNWRYDYAVMNFDFARAVTEGSEPNLRVLSNKGFDSFSVPIPAGAVVASTRFAGGLDGGNDDWQVNLGSDSVTWSAGAEPTLDWGTMYSFSITVNASPRPGHPQISARAANGSITLHVATAGEPAAYNVGSIVPTHL